MIIRDIIERLYWHYHRSELTGVELDKEDIEVLFLEMHKVEALPDYLRQLMRADRARYFSATSEGARSEIRGQYLRTLQFLRKLAPKTEQKAKSKTKSKLKLNRYG